MEWVGGDWMQSEQVEFDRILFPPLFFLDALASLPLSNMSEECKIKNQVDRILCQPLPLSFCLTSDKTRLITFFTSPYLFLNLRLTSEIRLLQELVSAGVQIRMQKGESG